MKQTADSGTLNSLFCLVSFSLLFFAPWLPWDEKPSSPLAPNTIISHLTSESKKWIQGSYAKTSETMNP